jgi:hypothetical protein
MINLILSAAVILLAVGVVIVSIGYSTLAAQNVRSLKMIQDAIRVMTLHIQEDHIMPLIQKIEEK